MFSHLAQNRARMNTLPTSIQCYIGYPSQWSRQEKEIKGTDIRKQVISKTNYLMVNFKMCTSCILKLQILLIKFMNQWGNILVSWIGKPNTTKMLSFSNWLMGVAESHSND